ncbi:TetR/AcrR family transcriptional regulator [Pseudonocardia spirodelae]|uniref:TetR/AcrR family transcriptional regulator n=1 Tax=Pseudonocardia spirodelae TaxID=3133431 RepID=A0ABU8T0W3_9PSEU
MRGDRGGGRRRESRDDAVARTRAALLDAAADVFAERGYDGASVDEIARVAGVSVGSIYSRFGSKQDLFRALMSAYLDSDLGRVRAGVDVAPEQGLLELEAMLLETARSRPATLLDAETWAAAMRTPELHTALAGHHSRVRAEATELVARGRLAGGVDLGVPDEEVATAMIALFHGLQREYRLGSPGAVAPDLYSRMVLALTAGLAAAAAAAPHGETPGQP